MWEWMPTNIAKLRAKGTELEEVHTAFNRDGKALDEALKKTRKEEQKPKKQVTEKVSAHMEETKETKKKVRALMEDELKLEVDKKELDDVVGKIKFSMNPVPNYPMDRSDEHKSKKRKRNENKTKNTNLRSKM